MKNYLKSQRGVAFIIAISVLFLVLLIGIVSLKTSTTDQSIASNTQRSTRASYAAESGVAKASLEANVRFLAADLGPGGTRVNAISAGPIKTLAAAGVSGFRRMLTHVAAATPLRRNVTIEEVGNVAAFLCSDLASGMTGEIVYVDAGYSHVGMSFPEGD